MAKQSSTPGMPRLLKKPSPQEVIEPRLPSGSGGGGGISSKPSATGPNLPIIPDAVVGVPVPSIIGRKRITAINLIWFGNVRPGLVDVTEVDEDGITVTTKVEAYLADLMFSVCLGPEVKLISVYAGDTVAWTGSIGPSRTEQNLGESDTSLSGIDIVWSGGAFNQAPEPDINESDFTGHPGIATVLLKGVNVSERIVDLSFEVERIPNGLGLSSGSNATASGDVNLATLMYEVITNGWGFGGVDSAEIDSTSFTAAAATLSSEGNYGTVYVDSEVGTSTLIKEIEKQAQGILFQHPETGLLNFKLYRDGVVDYANVPVFSPNYNIIEIRQFDKTFWPDTFEFARATYVRRDLNYTTGSIFAENTANFVSVGRGKRSGSISYPLCHDGELAKKLLARDLAIMAVPNFAFTIVTNRDGANVLPGDVIIVNHPKFQLLSTPALVYSVRRQPMDNNTVVMRCRQFKYPDTTPIFGEDADAVNPDVDFTPLAPVDVEILDAPYYFRSNLQGSGGQQYNNLLTQLWDVRKPLFLATPANNYQSSFNVYEDNKTGYTDPVKIGNKLGYVTVAELVNGISRWDGADTGEIASVAINEIVNNVNLVSVGEDGVLVGRVFLFVNDEIMSFEAAAPSGIGEYTLTSVHRGLLDTVAQDHSAGDKVYILTDRNVSGSQFWADTSYIPDFIFTGSSLFKDQAPDHSGVLALSTWSNDIPRSSYPYRPHNLQVNAQPRSSDPVAIDIGSSVTVTWKNRSREFGMQTFVKLQLDDSDPLEASVGSEYEQAMEIVLVDSNSVEHICDTVNEGDTSVIVPVSSSTFNVPEVATGLGYIFGRTKLTYSPQFGSPVTRKSIYEDRIPVLVYPEEPIETTEDDFMITTEDGDLVIME